MPGSQMQHQQHQQGAAAGVGKRQRVGDTVAGGLSPPGGGHKGPLDPALMVLLTGEGLRR